jgi:hypothetical protein
MPTVLNLIGMSPAQAVFAASRRDLGAIFAVLYLGLAIDRIGPECALALHYAAGTVFIAVIALFALPYSVLCVIIFLAGMTIIGSQTGVNGACGNSIRRACAPLASGGRSASGGLAESSHQFWAGICWRSACHRRKSFWSPVCLR